MPFQIVILIINVITKYETINQLLKEKIVNLKLFHDVIVDRSVTFDHKLSRLYCEFQINIKVNVESMF